MCALEASSQFIFERCVVGVGFVVAVNEVGRFAFELHNGYRHAEVGGTRSVNASAKWLLGAGFVAAGGAWVEEGGWRDSVL